MTLVEYIGQLLTYLVLVLIGTTFVVSAILSRPAWAALPLLGTVVAGGLWAIVDLEKFPSATGQMATTSTSMSQQVFEPSTLILGFIAFPLTALIAWLLGRIARPTLVTTRFPRRIAAIMNRVVQQPRPTERFFHSNRYGNFVSAPQGR